MKIKPKEPTSLNFSVHEPESLASDVLFDREVSGLDNKMRFELHLQEVEDRKQNREERKKYADGLFSMVCVWLLLVLGLVLAVAKGDAHLSDNVLITLITTTTASVIGIFLIVIRYLFKSDKSLPEK